MAGRICGPSRAFSRAFRRGKELWVHPVHFIGEIDLDRFDFRLGLRSLALSNCEKRPFCLHR